MPRPKRPPPGFILDLDDRNPRRRRTSKSAGAPAPEAAAASSVAGGGELPRAFKRCRALLDKLLRDDDGWVFAKPVDARALGLRDYYTVVRDPMDLGTVLRRLERGRYADPLEFAADVRLTFSNAMSYNKPGDPVHQSAAELSEIFEAGWDPILASIPPPPPTDAERKARLRADLTRMPKDAQHWAVAILKDQGAFVERKKKMVKVNLAKADAAALDELDELVAEQHKSA